MIKPKTETASPSTTQVFKAWHGSLIYNMYDINGHISTTAREMADEEQAFG
jgi:hypothetical protein